MRNTKYEVSKATATAQDAHSYISVIEPNLICPAPGSRPTLSPSVGLLALLVGLNIILERFAGVARALRARLTPAYAISPLDGAQ